MEDNKKKNILIFSLIGMLVLSVGIFITTINSESNKLKYNKKEFEHQIDSINNTYQKTIDSFTRVNNNLKLIVITKKQNLKTIENEFKKDSVRVSSNSFNIDSFITSELNKRR